MKTLAILFGLYLSSLLGSTHPQQSATLRVTLENVLNERGQILIGLHSRDTFMKGPGLKNAALDAQSGNLTVTFTDVAPGTYAIAVLHDENGNHQMDYTPEGMPAEHYAVSGYTQPMGPPVFEGVSFEVAGEDLEVRLRF